MNSLTLSLCLRRYCWSEQPIWSRLCTGCLTTTRWVSSFTLTSDLLWRAWGRRDVTHLRLILDLTDLETKSYRELWQNLLILIFLSWQKFLYWSTWSFFKCIFFGVKKIQNHQKLWLGLVDRLSCNVCYVILWGSWSVWHHYLSCLSRSRRSDWVRAAEKSLPSHDWILTEFDNMDEATARFRVRLLLEFDKQDVGIEQTGLFVEIISVMLSLPEPQPVRDKHTFSGRNFDGSWDLLQQSILFWKYQNYPLIGNCKMMLMLPNMYVVTDKSPKHNDQQTVIFLSNMQSAQM